MSTILDRLQQIQKDTEWLHSYYDELIKKHDQEYIAIKNQNVVEHDVDLDELKKKLKGRNIEAKNVLIEFIRDKKNQV